MQARAAYHFDIWSYVIMPEHVHLLIFPRDDEYSISDMLKDIKQPVTRAALKHVRRYAPSFLPTMLDAQPNGERHYRFWQRGGGYDRNMIRLATVHQEIRYIHANPVRRGLVDAPEDWPWSSARYFAGRADVPIIPDVGSIPRRRRQ